MTKNDFFKTRTEQGGDLLVHDTLCEECVLGAILLDNSVYDEHREQLNPSCFYNPKHEEIFKAIVAVRERGDEADLMSVYAELQKSKSDVTMYEVTKISSCGIRIDIPMYVERLVHLARCREIWLIAKKLEPVGTTDHDDIEKLLEL